MVTLPTDNPWHWSPTQIFFHYSIELIKGTSYILKLNSLYLTAPDIDHPLRTFFSVQYRTDEGDITQTGINLTRKHFRRKLTTFLLCDFKYNGFCDSGKGRIFSWIPVLAIFKSSPFCFTNAIKTRFCWRARASNFFHYWLRTSLIAFVDSKIVTVGALQIFPFHWSCYVIKLIFELSCWNLSLFTNHHYYWTWNEFFSHTKSSQFWRIRLRKYHQCCAVQV